MELPAITIAVSTIAIGLSGTCFWIGRYVERLSWNKLIWEGKLPKPEKEKRFEHPIIESNAYERNSK